MSSRITIPQPCPATWNQMTPAPGGRHCAACNKVVVDFTQLSEAEVLVYLQQHPEACGRFQPAHIRQISTWAPWLAAAVVALTACETEPQPVETPSELIQQAVSEQFSVRGKVLDKNTGQPLIHALIISEQDTTRHTRTLADGSFHFLLPRHLLGTRLVAAVDDRLKNSEEHLGLYRPKYFTADDAILSTIYLRNPVPVIGSPKLEPNECLSPAVLPYIFPAVPPPPPPPELTTTKSENEPE